MTEAAVGNTSTYIQGRVNYSTSTSSSGITVSVTFQMRRTNPEYYSGDTYSTTATPSICISGDSGNFGYTGGAGITVHGSSSWQNIYSASRTFDASRSGDTIYVGWKVSNDNSGYLGGSKTQAITLPSAYSAPSTPSISASRSSNTVNSITYGVSSFGTPSSGTVYLYGGTSSTPTTQIASKTTTGNSTFSHTGLSEGTTYYYRARAYNGQLYSSYSSTVSVTTYKAPTKPTISINSRAVSSNTITYGTTSFGDPSSGTVYLYGGTSASPTTQIASKTSTGNSNYTHSSLTNNTKYYYRTRAYNSKVYSAYSSDVTAVTLPAALSAKSAAAASTTSIKVSYTTAAGGTAYTKNIQYSLNNSTWTTGATVSAGTATSGNFTITGLTTGTAYTIYLRVNTSAGSTSSGSVSATTYKVPNNPTVSASNTSATANSITYGTTSFNTPSTGTVYLYGGTSASPTTQIASKTTTGNSSYSHTGLTGNTKYYYRARANNTGGNSSYSSDATATTVPAAPTLAVSNLRHNKVTISVKSPTQGSANTMTAYYTLNGGTAVSMGTVTSGNTVTATPTLTPGTSYTIVAYLSTSAGNSTTVTQTIATPLPFYVPVSGRTKYAKTLYCSVSGKTKKVKHLYGAVPEPVLSSVSGSVVSGGSGNVTAFNGSTFLTTATQNPYLYERVVRGGKTISRIYFQFTASDTWMARIYFSDNTIANIGHSLPVPSPDYMGGTPITDYTDLGITASFVEAGSDDINLSGTYTTGYFTKRIF